MCQFGKMPKHDTKMSSFRFYNPQTHAFQIGKSRSLFATLPQNLQTLSMKHSIMQVIQCYAVTLCSWACIQLAQCLIEAIILQKQSRKAFILVTCHAYCYGCNDEYILVLPAISIPTDLWESYPVQLHWNSTKINNSTSQLISSYTCVRVLDLL